LTQSGWCTEQVGRTLHLGVDVNSLLALRFYRRLGSQAPLRARPFRHSGKTGEGFYMVAGHNDVDHPSRQNGAVVDRGRPCIWIRDEAELTVITISGEIDASDIGNMSPYARRLVRDCGVLIIDLSGIDFIAIDALRALFALWSPDSATTEPPRSHVMRICSERITFELRRDE
jgi:hypothetical protein